MKKLVLIIAIATITISCKEDKIKNLQTDIEERIKAGLNDPSSYEFNHFYIDSTGYSSTNQLIAENQKKIKELQKKTDDETAQDKIIDLEVQNNLYKRMQNYKYNGNFEFRGNNKFGAKILADYKFEADSTFTLMYLMDNSGDTIYKDVEIVLKETDKLLKESDELTK